jgi:DNA-binding beta-propeller fold protein YncE
VTFNVGISPDGTAFDGANIWVTNFTGFGNGMVTKLRASDGSVLGTFTVGAGPIGIAFDGANIWVSGSNAIIELRASDGKLLLGLGEAGNASSGIAFDGANIWVALSNAASVEKL